MTCDPDEVINYPMEFLHFFKIKCWPPYKLILKTGVPDMLLRNLQLLTLCNGRRLCIKTLNKNIPEVTVLTGNGKLDNLFFIIILIFLL